MKPVSCCSHRQYLHLCLRCSKDYENETCSRWSADEPGIRSLPKHTYVENRKSVMSAPEAISKLRRTSPWSETVTAGPQTVTLYAGVEYQSRNDGWMDNAIASFGSWIDVFFPNLAKICVSHPMASCEPSNRAVPKRLSGLCSDFCLLPTRVQKSVKAWSWCAIASLASQPATRDSYFCTRPHPLLPAHASRKKRSWIDISRQKIRRLRDSNSCSRRK
jgi:hypothetical protein